MSELALLPLAQFCEQHASVVSREPHLQEHRRTILTNLLKTPVHRATKAVIASIDLPALSSQCTAPLGSEKLTYTLPDPAYGISFPENIRTLPESYTKSFPVQGTTPLLQVAELMWNAGLSIVIPRGTVLAAPIQIPVPNIDSVWPLIRIIVEPDCDVMFIEEHTGVPQNQTILAHSTEIIIQNNSTVQLLRIFDRTNPSVPHHGIAQRTLSVARVRLGQDSRLKQLTAVFGGTRGRIESDIVVAGPGADLDDRIMHLTTENEPLFFVSNVTHEAPASRSRMQVRGAVGGTSYVRFEGNIKITAGSQLTDAGLDEKTLFLSNSAKHDSVPGLEIDADDVRATHASSISKIDEEQLFYLASRGLSREESQHLIIDGMLRSLTNGMHESIAERTLATITERINGTPLS